jgi:hypothetical protein
MNKSGICCMVIARSALAQKSKVNNICELSCNFKALLLLMDSPISSVSDWKGITHLFVINIEQCLRARRVCCLSSILNSAYVQGVCAVCHRYWTVFTCNARRVCCLSSILNSVYVQCKACVLNWIALRRVIACATSNSRNIKMSENNLFTTIPVVLLYCCYYYSYSCYYHYYYK